MKVRTVIALLAPGLAAAVQHQGQGGRHAGAAAELMREGDDSAMNPIRKVVNMLQKMVQKVEAEAKKEEEMYDKYVCYCRTAGGDLAKSIAESDTKVPQTQNDIEEGEAELERLKQDLASHQTDRAAAKSAVEAATGQRESEHKVFVEASTEYKTYLEALSRAIPAISKGMSGGALLQASGAAGGERLRRAVADASSLTDYDRGLVTAFLSGTSTGQAGYVPKSQEIVGILKSIEEDFQKNLDEVTEAEEKSVGLYKELTAAKQKEINTLQEAVEKKMQRTGDLQVELVNMKNELTETEAALIADQNMQAELETSCKTKEGEWQERSKTRAEELVALHETIKVLNDDDALDLFKKALPSASLLQVKANKAQLRSRALAALKSLPRNRAAMDFLVLALSGKQVDFSKIFTMIDDMLSLLKQEQVDDDSHKEYCEKSIDSAEDKVKDLTRKADDLEMDNEARAEAIKTLIEELKELQDGVHQLDRSVAEETELRKEEHDEHSALMQENTQAKELLAFAKNRLNKFYNPDLHVAPPQEAQESFLQVARHGEPGPKPATWSGDYQKKGQETTGVLSMLDRLVKDLELEMTESETEERNAQKAYEELMQDAAAKRAADVKAVAAKERAKADFQEGKVAAEAEHKITTKELQATKMYQMSLHQECDWLQQNYDLRRQARTEEAESLKQAKAILSGADFSLLQAPAERRGLAVAKRLRGA